MRRQTLAATLVAVAAIAAGCGDDGDSDEEAISALLTQFGEDQSDEGQCGRYISTRLVDRIYGSEARCQRLAREDAQDSPDFEIEDVEITGTRVTGDRARSRLALRLEGVPLAGGVTLRRQGDDWRIDGLSAQFLRALLRDGPKVGFIAEGFPEPFRDRTINDCLAEPFERPDDEMVRFGYDALGERRGADREVSGTFARCLVAERPGRAALRGLFEKGLREDRSIPAAVTNCIVARLRRTATSRLIARESARQIETDSEAEIGPELSRLIQQAAIRCAGPGGVEPGQTI